MSEKASVTLETANAVEAALWNAESSLESSANIMEDEMNRASANWSDNNFEQCKSYVKKYANCCRKAIPILKNAREKVKKIEEAILEYNS